MKRLLLLFIAIVVVVGWLLFPTTDIATPDWEVLVTDLDGRPLAGAEVTVFSQQYTLESRDVETTKVTGADGRVHFDERLVKAEGLRRLAGVIANLDQGVHASFGVHTFLAANKDGYGNPTKLALFAANEKASRANGAARQSAHLLLMKCQEGYYGMGCLFPLDPEKPILPYNP